MQLDLSILTIAGERVVMVLLRTATRSFVRRELRLCFTFQCKYWVMGRYHAVHETILGFEAESFWKFPLLGYYYHAEDDVKRI